MCRMDFKQTRRKRNASSYSEIYVVTSVGNSAYSPDKSDRWSIISLKHTEITAGESTRPFDIGLIKALCGAINQLSPGERELKDLEGRPLSIETPGDLVDPS